MKISIPVDEKKNDTNVCMSFGRTPYFLIYDSETKESKYIDNTAAASSGGAGIKAAQIIVDSKAEALLTPRCGENAAEVLKAGGVKIYKTKGESVKDNIDAYLSGKLSELQEIHPGLHNHGSR